MPLNLRGKPVDELNADTHTVSSVGCGVVSVVLVGATATASYVKLYDTNDESSLGNVKKHLSTGGSNAPTTVVYCPCKPDAFSVGVVAVVNGSGALAYVTIEP